MLCLACSLAGCTAAPPADADGDAGHTETSVEYSAYYSDSSYVPPTNDAISAAFTHSDPVFVQSKLVEVEGVATPNALHGASLIFDPCPDPADWSGAATRVLLVPTEYPTIQAAIDVAKNYQIVSVDPTLAYTENLRIEHKFVHLVSSSSAKVSLTPADPALPAILFQCGGGGLVGGFEIQNAGIGIKADTTALGINTIIDCAFSANTIGLLLIDSHVALLNNTFSTEQDGAILVRSIGSVLDNTFQGGTGIALYLQAPRGMTITSNIFDQDGIGQGALFIDGGAVIVEGNTFTLNDAAFGMIAQYLSADVGLGLEVLENTITDAKAVGMVVLGAQGNTTQAYLADNTINSTAQALSDENFAWLQYAAAQSGGSENEDAFVFGAGIVVMDANADTISNVTTQNVLAGIVYARSCGQMTSNTSHANTNYDLITKAFGDTDSCSLPTLEGNDYDTIWDDDASNGDGTTLEVPDEPMEVPVP